MFDTRDRSVPFSSFQAIIEYHCVDPSSEPVCVQGDLPDYFYVILSGALSVKVNVPGVKSQVTVGVMTAGQIFGELAMVRRNRF